MFSVVGLVLGAGVGFFISKEELKGQGAVTADAKQDRNITFTKI